ncbi:MAG TPA: glycoside hydrolase [Chloroflexi bacterium]|nr:glycoside hydrolase [Chloroflexota bacterium]
MSALDPKPLASLCIHGHFYQPPREDPFTGEIPAEHGAEPYRNWNERIHAECYRPNATLGNLERISFNVGPTLFRWLAEHDPLTTQRIVRSDRHNLLRYGVGNAMAQVYNHTILPLASHRDKELQVAWGIADFEHRFGRPPQGMWLAETAADNETLDVLAGRGIQFTILAPWQAEPVDLDPTQPYRIKLPSGRSIIVFFYERELSGRVSFDPGITSNADSFAQWHVLPKLRSDKLERAEPQLITIATDGELYGHHQKFRDLFLNHLVNGSGRHAGLAVTYPALWLRDHPVRHVTGIRDKTSWSCHHGVLRWSGNCDCTWGDGTWKARLRAAFDRLAGRLDALYESQALRLSLEPWPLLERYIQVVLGQQSADDLIQSAASRPVTAAARRRLALLLEAQYYRQWMYTSCGWFFDDLDRIEPKNNIAYAARAVLVARLATGKDLGPAFGADLGQVVSPRTGLRGDTVYQHALTTSRPPELA